LDAAHVWDVAEDAAGNLYAATGDEGKIYKVAPAGTVTVAYASDDSQVLCLKAAADGTVYAGTGPGGKVIRLTADGTATVLYRTGESYVWSLALDEEGKCLYAGTGPSGNSSFARADGDSSDATPVPTGGKKPVAATLASTLPSSSREKDSDKGGPAPTAPAPTSGENSVYRIAADGTARELFREK